MLGDIITNKRLRLPRFARNDTIQVEIATLLSVNRNDINSLEFATIARNDNFIFNINNKGITTKVA